MLKKALSAFTSYKWHWQWFRDFFSIAILRYFVLWFSLVPFVLQVFKTVPELVPLWFSGVVILISPVLPFNWVLLWIASLLYTVALIIYVVRCPDFIKKYPTYQSYQAHGHSPRWVVWLVMEVHSLGGPAWSKLLGRMRAKGYVRSIAAPALTDKPVLVEQLESRFQFKEGEGWFDFAMPRIVNGNLDEVATAQAEQELFWEIFGAFAGSRVVARRVVIALLLVTLALFVWVLGQHVWSAVPDVLAELGLAALLVAIE